MLMGHLGIMHRKLNFCQYHAGKQSMYVKTSQEGIKFIKAKEQLRAYCPNINILCEKEKEEKKKKNRKAIKELFNWPILIFFGILFQGGVMWGVLDTYLFIYLQDELNASSQLISKYVIEHYSLSKCFLFVQKIWLSP